MANKIITIIADKERHLKLGINGLIEIEKMLDKPLAQLGENMGFEDFRTILYVALKWEDKKLTLEQTGDLMDDYIATNGFEKLGQTIGELITAAMGNLPSQA